MTLAANEYGFQSGQISELKITMYASCLSSQCDAFWSFGVNNQKYANFVNDFDGGWLKTHNSPSSKGIYIYPSCGTSNSLISGNASTIISSSTAGLRARMSGGDGANWDKLTTSISTNGNTFPVTFEFINDDIAGTFTVKFISSTFSSGLSCTYASVQTLADFTLYLTPDDDNELGLLISQFVIESINTGETSAPSSSPTQAPTFPPTSQPSPAPTEVPTPSTPSPTTATPTDETAAPSFSPTLTPTEAPTSTPTLEPTSAPTSIPTLSPTAGPTSTPSLSPTSPPTSTPTDVTDSPSESPTGAPSPHPFDRYEIGPNPVNFTSGQRYCDSLQKTLAVIRSIEDNNNVHRLCDYKDTSEANGCWIGLSKDAASVWKWGDNVNQYMLEYLNNEDEFPIITDFNDYCAAIPKNDNTNFRKWESYPCDELKYPICDHPTFAPTLSPTVDPTESTSTPTFSPSPAPTFAPSLPTSPPTSCTIERYCPHDQYCESGWSYSGSKCNDECWSCGLGATCCDDIKYCERTVCTEGGGRRLLESEINNRE